jgi:hypothetical protein
MKKPASQIPTDLDIQALVDSQLEWEEEKHVRLWLSRDEVLHARYEELMAQKKLLLAWWESEQAPKLS